MSSTAASSGTAHSSGGRVNKNKQEQVVAWVLGHCESFPVPVQPAPAALHALKLAFLPATGVQSGALARAYAKAGCHVIVGSRSLAKAQAKRQELLDEAGGAMAGGAAIIRPERVEAMELRAAAAAADVVFWLLPTPTKQELDECHALLASFKDELQGKVVVDVTNVLWALDDTVWGQTSSTLLNQAALGAPARWTCAFKHTYYTLLNGAAPPPASDNPHNVFVCGDDPEAVGVTMALVDLVPGFKAMFAGSLKYTRIVELLSPLWLPQLERDNCNGLHMTAGWRFGP